MLRSFLAGLRFAVQCARRANPAKSSIIIGSYAIAAVCAIAALAVILRCSRIRNAPLQ
jgi:hypothetical protein